MTFDHPDNKAIDRRTGRPLLVWRGEHGRKPEGDGRKFHSKVASLTFSGVEAADYYAREPNDRTETAEYSRITAAHVDIRNPIVDSPDDPFIDMEKLSALGPAEKMRIALKFASDIEYTGNWMETLEPQTGCGSVKEFLARFPERIDELYFLAFKLLDDPEEVAKLVAAGYDGAVHGGYGDGHDPEYKVFDEAQTEIVHDREAALIAIGNALRGRNRSGKREIAEMIERTLDRLSPDDPVVADLMASADGHFPIEAVDRAAAAAWARRDEPVPAPGM